MAVPLKLVGIGVLVVVIVVVLAFVVGPLLAPAAFQTTITVVDPSGASHVIHQDGALFGGAVVTVNGIQVSAVNYQTTFKGSSPQYNQFVLTNQGTTISYSSGQLPASGVMPAPLTSVSGVDVLLWWTQNVDGINVVTICGQSATSVPTSATSQLAVGTTYNLAKDIMGISSGNAASVSSNTIIGWSTANGCPGTGSFELTYVVQLTAKAVGTGTVPNALWWGYWNVGLSISTGTLTLTGYMGSSTSMIGPVGAAPALDLVGG